MAAFIPEGGIALRGVDAGADQSKTGSSTAILFKLSDDVLQDLKKAHAQGGLSLSTGDSPKLRIGDRTIDLTISADAFRNELYASTTGTSTTDLSFRSVISHRAMLKTSERKSKGDTAGSDAALAALQNSLASYEQEKQAKQTTITNSILPTPKNRFDAAKKEHVNKNRSLLKATPNSQPGTPSLSAAGTPRLGPAPTSMPTSEEALKIQAMRTSVIHLLAMDPLRSGEIMKRTHIPKDDLENILQKVGKRLDGEWHSLDRSYKDLDVWSFEYRDQEDRQKAVDHAIKAFDRMRIGKDEKLWQMLLPKKDRGKGIVLSRLHLGGGYMNAGLTPNYQPSPMPHLDGTGDHKIASAVNTPRLGATTPRPGSSKGDVMKRLLSKDPKKARAAEEAKEKKRKEREAAASDREGAPPAKKQATKKANVQAKSAEFVHSSDEDSDVGEVAKSKNSQPKQPSKANVGTQPKSRPKAVTTESSDSSDTPIKAKKDAQKPVVKAKSNDTPARAATTHEGKAAKSNETGKSTPQKATTNGLFAPDSQHKSQRSPRQSDSRPNVPSPLGAARPRVASDVSDRGAIGVQKPKQGGETPKGLGISDGARKRHDTVTSTGSASPNGSQEKSVKPASSQSQSQPKTNGMDAVNQKPNGSTKRKAEDSTAQQAVKHAKPDPNASQTHSAQPISNGSANGTAQTPPPTSDPTSNAANNATDVMDTMTFGQGVNIAEKFRDVYYPAYTKLYDELEAKEARGETISSDEKDRLMAMHRRLEQIKREVSVASGREHVAE